MTRSLGGGFDADFDDGFDDDADKEDEMDGPWYWCLTHDRVEPENGCPNIERMGPYLTREEAETALERARVRTEAWDEADSEWSGWNDDGT